MNTNSTGQYHIFNLLPANYTITIKAQGFKTVDVAAFRLDVSEAIMQNTTLQVGTQAETIEVHTDTQLLEATTVGNSTTIEAAQMNDLPLDGRNYTALIALTPGADSGTPANPTTRISEQWGDGNRYALDGANNTTLLSAASAYVPNLDIIQEFSLDSHGSKAEEGGFLGGTVSAATKSGSNKQVSTPLTCGQVALSRKPNWDQGIREQGERRDPARK